MILASAAAKVAAAGVTKAAPLQPAHQALGNHFVKTLPVLLGNEDPDKHCGIRNNLRRTGEAFQQRRSSFQFSFSCV